MWASWLATGDGDGQFHDSQMQLHAPLTHLLASLLPDRAIWLQLRIMPSDKTDRQDFQTTALARGDPLHPLAAAKSQAHRTIAPRFTNSSLPPHNKQTRLALAFTGV